MRATQQTTRSYARNTRAFTMIEILVVAAVIALLATVLFAVLGEVREKSRASVVAQQLQEIEKALKLFAIAKQYHGWWWGRNCSPAVPGFKPFCPDLSNHNNMSIQKLINARVGFERYMAEAPISPIPDVRYEYDTRNSNPYDPNCGSDNFWTGVNIRLEGYSEEDHDIVERIDKIIDGTVHATCGKFRWGGGSGSAYYLIGKDRNDI